MCQPPILQEWSNHKEGKEEVEPKQANNSQMTGSRVLFTNIHGSKKGEEDHTQGRDNSSDITEYTKTKDTVREDNPDLRTTNSSGNITKIKLEVKNNVFITANGRKILENTTFSTNIRDLMNHLIGKQKAPKSDNDKLEPKENNIKGLIDASHKTIVTVINYEDDKKKMTRSPMI